MIFMMYVQTVCSCARASMPLSAGSQRSTDRGSLGYPWPFPPPPPHNSGFFKMHKYKECSWHESLLELGKCSPFFVLSGVWKQVH